MLPCAPGFCSPWTPMYHMERSRESRKPYKSTGNVTYKRSLAEVLPRFRSTRRSTDKGSPSGPFPALDVADPSASIVRLDKYPLSRGGQELRRPTQMAAKLSPFFATVFFALLRLALVLAHPLTDSSKLGGGRPAAGPPNCFPAIGFTMPSKVPSSLANWWCPTNTEYAFVGFSYEITPCNVFAALLGIRT